MAKITLQTINENATGGNHEVTLGQQGNASAGNRKITLPANDSSIVLELTAPAKTSAGIYSSDTDRLLKTLWSDVYYAAGTHPIEWDGTDDAGNLLPEGNYDFQVISHNISFDWQVLGNTSVTAGIPYPNIFRGNSFLKRICITGSTMYHTIGYNESKPCIRKVDLSNPNYNINIGGVESEGWTNAGVCTDGTLVYWAMIDNSDGTYVVFARNVSDDTKYTFPSSSDTYSQGGVLLSVISKSTTVGIRDIGVQQSGNALLVVHGTTVEVYHKTTGALIATNSVTAPKRCCIDTTDKVWIVHDTNVIEQYSISAGILTSTGKVINAAYTVGDIKVNPAGTILTVVNLDTNQLIDYTISTLAVASTFGISGGNSLVSTIQDNRFNFSDNGIDYAPDGSLFVVDDLNLRLVHYNTSKVLITGDTVSFAPSTYACTIDLNDPIRVFYRMHEFRINYADNTAVKVANWTTDLTATETNQYAGLLTPVTLAGHGTFCLLREGEGFTLTVARLNNDGTLTRGQSLNSNTYRFDKDGNLVRASLFATGQATRTYISLLTGYDTNGFPVHAAETLVAQTAVQTQPTEIGWKDLTPSTYRPAQRSQTPLGVDTIVLYDCKATYLYQGTYIPMTGKHLMAIDMAGNIVWKSCPANYENYSGEYPEAMFDIGNAGNRGSPTAGGGIVTVDKFIVTAFNREFWKDREACFYSLWYSNGLFIGMTGASGVGSDIHPEGFAGNAHYVQMVKNGENLYIYHPDETTWCGVHQRKVSGLDTVQLHKGTIHTPVKEAGLSLYTFTTSDHSPASYAGKSTETTFSKNTAAVTRSEIRKGFINIPTAGSYTFYIDTAGIASLVIEGNTIIAPASGALSGTAAFPSAGYYAIQYYTSFSNAAYQLVLSIESAGISKRTLTASDVLTSPTTITSTPARILLNEVLPNVQGNLIDTALIAGGWHVAGTLGGSGLDFFIVSSGKKSVSAVSTDIEVSFRSTTYPKLCTLQFPLAVGFNNPAWQLSLTLLQSGNNGSGNGGTNIFLDVLDVTGKIIARYQQQYADTYPDVRVVGNRTTLATYTQTDNTVRTYQPLIIKAVSGNILFSYAGMSFVTTTAYDVLALNNQPATIQVTCQQAGAQNAVLTLNIQGDIEFISA